MVGKSVWGIVKGLFEYFNYREFMQDFYISRKRENPNFSFNIFSELCGFKNKSVINNIIKGRINLSRQSIARVSNAMQLKGPEREYFEYLVRFNQAKGIDERNRLFHRLESIKKQGIKTGPAQQIRKDQYEYYSKLYHSTIRSIIDLYPFDGDYKWLAKMVSPAIRPLQAKKSVQLLEKLGLITRKKDGYYKVTHKKIEASGEILSLGVMNYHIDAAEMAKQALSDTSKKKKSYAGQTLGISRECYKDIIREIDRFQDRIAEMAEKDRKADAVFQLNFQLFQASERDNKKVKE
jgi:uncharacterized protein (TIGR02147 family)